ncbi:MAG: chemotaxis response regulator protein-glutamate methylesterase [Verrucomicrobia bacterium]|nr:chemotaxis response regulator protein-glutamate methylesterase [Verrucomicrobiota bacterium]
MRIGIANDMHLAVRAIRNALEKTAEHEVIWVAKNGVEAVQFCANDTPDLILMDLMMPVMGGIEATRRIMADTPCAILLVTAFMDNESEKVFEALGAGALDAVSSADLDPTNPDGSSSTLLAKINMMGRLTGRGGSRRRSTESRSPTPQASRPLIAIGASAGGPAALCTVLSSLPSNFEASIVVVQHIDLQFASGLAHWLDGQTRITVRIAAEGDQPQPGTALIAATNDHLAFKHRGVLGYTTHPETSFYRPSVDAFFQSAVSHWPGDIIGVLLTGIGRDGAEGLKQIRDANHHTIAQDRESCVVYGMPKAAVELNAAVQILPLDQIGPALTRMSASPSGAFADGRIRS